MRSKRLAARVRGGGGGVTASSSLLAADSIVRDVVFRRYGVDAQLARRVGRDVEVPGLRAVGGAKHLVLLQGHLSHLIGGME